MNNARVIKDAWAPFLLWCCFAALGLWWLEGQLYDVRLVNSQSTISSLTTQLSGARSDIQDLASPTCGSTRQTGSLESCISRNCKNSLC